jgi:hypothetical protein
MPFKKDTLRPFTYYFLFLTFTIGLAATSYAQPMFPPQQGNNNQGIASLPSTTSEPGTDPIRQQYEDNELLGFAGIHLVNAIRALQGDDTNSFNNNLNVSQHQFEAVLGPTETNNQENDNKSLAFAGINLINAIRSLQAGDANSLNSSLTVSLEQFAGVLGVSPSLMLNPPSSQEVSTPPADTSQPGGEQSPDTGQESRYDENELLAYAGIHLINAIRSFQNGDTNGLEGNLLTAQQQFWSARYPN